jgi:uncharacterized membrane protein YgaE (UPF0421/DUF939 family)
MALVVVASYELGFQCTRLFHDPSARIGGMWAAITGVLVLQATRQGTWSAAVLRVMATIVGAILAAVYLVMLPFGPAGLGGVAVVTVLLCHAARIPDHARVAVLTVVVMMVQATLNTTLSPLVSATLRIGESCLGAALAVTVTWLWPERRGTMPDTRQLGRV